MSTPEWYVLGDVPRKRPMKRNLTLGVVSVIVCYLSINFLQFLLGWSHHRPDNHSVTRLQSASVVGKVHALFGEENPTYERALKLHEQHSLSNGHPMFVLREKLLSGLWSKPAFILATILNEMALPEDVRLQWLLWNDADIVLMNSQIALDELIPPSPEFDYVNLLVTRDRHGLNNGCFLIRVNEWSIKLLSAVIAFHNYRPEVKLQYSEQSALEELIEDSYWRQATVRVPQVWFNAYPPPEEGDRPLRDYHYRDGLLQIHFAGNKDGKRPERMNRWMDIVERSGGISDFNATQYASMIGSFWDDLLVKRIAKELVEVVEVDVEEESRLTAEPEEPRPSGAN